jgi:hypothetical protein
MEDFETDYSAIAPLRAILDGAKQFGLTDAEILEIVDACAAEVGGDASVVELLDELTGALARNVVAKEQRVLLDEGRAARHAQGGPPKNPRS